MNVIALVLLQSIALGLGESRAGDIWRAGSERWDVAAVEVRAGPFVAGAVFRHGLTSDQFPSWVLGWEPVAVRRQAYEVGPCVRWDAKLGSVAGLAARVRLRGDFWLYGRATNRLGTLRLDWRPGRG